MVGIFPYQRAQEAWLGIVKLVQKLTDQGAFYVPHSMKLSCSYRDNEGVDAIERMMIMILSVRPLGRTGWTRLAPCVPAPCTGPASRHTHLAPCASCRALRQCLAPRALARAVRPVRVELRSPVSCQLASIGRQQVDEHML
jgi:hypothetical protein